MTANSDTRDGERVALFPGTFDPFTVGHASIVERGLELFDRVVIAVGFNSEKTDRCAADERVRRIAQLYADAGDRVDVLCYSGLTVDAAAAAGARFLLRGVRSTSTANFPA